MKRAFDISCVGGVMLAVWLLPAVSLCAEPPNGRFANSGGNNEPCFSQPEPGLVIDAANVETYACFLPEAAIEVVKHGFKIRIAKSHQFEWASGYQHATEQYSPQVHLDAEDNLTSYVAGMPFPLVKIDDPKAARKIAYNWHMGPYMPDDFALTPWTSSAYVDSADGTAKPVHGAPDSTYLCDQFTLLRFAHRTEVEPRPTLGENPMEVEWKARCGNWGAAAGGGVHGGRTIWLRFLDPHREDESFIFDESTRRTKRQAVDPPIVNLQCRQCHQPYWAYALPKTEAYEYRLLGTTPILAGTTADEEPAGFVGRDKDNHSDLMAGGDKVALGEQPFEMRGAYIIEMRPASPTYSNLRTLVWIDTESYVWLGAEFFESSKQTEVPELREVAVPLWHTRPAQGGGYLFDLAGSFYVPRAFLPTLPAHGTESGGQPWLFRSVTPFHGPYDQKINQGGLDDSVFNPRTLGN